MFQIIDASPDSLRKLCDYMNLLYKMTYDQDGKALRAGCITADKIDVASLFVGTGGIRIDPSATITWGQVTDKPNNITSEQLTQTLADYLNSGNFNTYITKDWIGTLGLAVGDQILMGVNAHISWNNVTDQPTIPTLPGYIQSTYIDATTIKSPTIEGNIGMFGNIMFEAGQTVQFKGTGTTPIYSLKLYENAIDAVGTSHRLWLNWTSYDDTADSEVHIGNGSGDGQSYGTGKLYAGEIYSFNKLVATYEGDAIIMGGPMIMPNNPQLWVQPDLPTASKTNDLWADTDDYSRYDITTLTAATVLNESDNEVIEANGTFTLTLHAATNPGIIKKIYNVGSGIITIEGTINGGVNLLLYPGESVELITDGSGWRY